jgi:hypothetical protein
MLQALLASLNRPLNIPKPRRPAHLRLRIRLLRRVIITSLVLLRRSARLRVLAGDLRFTRFLRVRRHVAGRRRSLATVVGTAGGDAGESAQGEGREALLRESGAAEGHSGGGGEEEVGCWGGHCGFVVRAWWCWCTGKQGKGKLYYQLVANISRDCDVTEFGHCDI